MTRYGIKYGFLTSGAFAARFLIISVIEVEVEADLDPFILGAFLIAFDLGSLFMFFGMFIYL